MKILKQIVARVIPIGVLAFLITAAIAYQRGVYDITFIERPESTDSDTTVAADTDTSADTTPDDTTEPDTSVTVDPGLTSSSDSSGDQNPPLTSPITDYLNSLKRAADMPGWNLSYKDYGISMRIALADFDLNGDFYLRDMDTTKHERVANETYGGYTTVSSTVRTERPLVDVYMDYVLVDNGSTVSIYSGDGALITSGVDIEFYQPAYTRDKNNVPLFKVAAGVKEGKIVWKYYKLEGSSFVESDYKESDGRGLYFNYTPDFGKSDSELNVYEKNGYYGYGRSQNSMVTTYRYTEAFNYSEGLAAVVKPESTRPDFLMLSYVNTRYFDELYCMKGYWNGWYYNEVEQRVAANYRLPDTRGIESIGFFYFDHGLCRVRKQEHNYYWTYQTQRDTRLMTDEDLVIRSDGTVFDLPGGYHTTAYSCGVFVLTRDDHYGCMDYTGNWIASPDYDYISAFQEGLAVVTKDGKSGMIDTSGNFVIPMVFDYIQPCSNGAIAVWSESDGWFVLNKLA